MSCFVLVSLLLSNRCPCFILSNVRESSIGPCLLGYLIKTHARESLCSANDSSYLSREDSYLFQFILNHYIVLTTFSSLWKQQSTSENVDTMWVNFQKNELKPSLQNMPSSSGTSAVHVPSVTVRQNSSQSSFKSNRSTRSTTSLLKKKVEEHAFQRNTVEWQREQDYKVIRERRKRLRIQMDIKLRCVRRLFIPAILGIVLGIVVLFGSTIRTLGDGTIFWTHRDVVKYVGVFLIIVGVVFLLTAVGLESSNLDKFKQEGFVDHRPEIHADFLLEEEAADMKKHVVGDNAFTSCSGLERQGLLWQQVHNEGEDGFLCSSISSSTSCTNNPGSDQTSRWAQAMALNFEGNETGHVKSHDVPSVECNIKRIDSAQLRALNNAPNIEITTVDELFGNNGGMSVQRARVGVGYPIPQCSYRESSQNMRQLDGLTEER